MMLWTMICGHDIQVQEAWPCGYGYDHRYGSSRGDPGWSGWVMLAHRQHAKIDETNLDPNNWSTVVGKYHQKPILRIPICLNLWGLCLWPETSWETWMIQHLGKICWNNRWRSRQTRPGPRATMAKMGFSLPRRKREVLVDIMRYIHSMIYRYMFFL